MADPDLESPLIHSPSSDPPELVITVNDGDYDSGSDHPACAEPHGQNQNHRAFSVSDNHNSRNPYDFLGASELSVLGLPTVDPFRNETPGVSGLYEALKVVVCLPIALVRLVLFGLSLAVGYVATRLALEGWKDKQNPMPKWRCRIMWVTRICTRCILFSFGYQWIKRKGKPAPREIAPIVVSNHVSYIDPIFYFYELFPTIVASEAHDSIPFVGTIIRAMQVIYVNRFSQTSRKNAVHEIKVQSCRSEYRERPHAINFLVCCCSRRAPRLTGNSSFPSNSVLSFLVTQFNL
ncbi:PREDICTED: lysophospholipid acyltransferase LPEAT2-like isoform X2 [Tarenaya hassleriana]|uniref:lysophospholipid acyltransferase LPEAT2-like isoform X2 n=1 Tax=Tarenaya hassleriana TaxID=28532 RepID=UPI00053C9E5F|nr:PREDICTED: lysophospholipid acyltransferase LPEAT2-like isoform X2 [Tarenaya hassleriana]